MNYTKAQLEQIILTQLENLEATGELLRLLRKQNELLHKANEEIEERIYEIKRKRVRYNRVS